MYINAGFHLHQPIQDDLYDPYKEFVTGMEIRELVSSEVAIGGGIDLVYTNLNKHLWSLRYYGEDV